MNAAAIGALQMFRYDPNRRNGMGVTTFGWVGVWTEETMRRYVVAAAAALAVLVAGPLATGGAEAFPASVPAGPAMAGGNGLVQDVAYVCRRVRTCGYYGCRWHRACYWTGPRHHRSWRHRYYRRHHW